METQGAIEGRLFLVVEDEYLTASSLVLALEDAGATVLGPVPDAAAAREILANAASQPDAAVLDVNLRGEMVYTLAKELQHRHVPIVFVTGYNCDRIPLELRSVPCLSKPCDERALTGLLATISEGNTSVPMP